MPSTTAGTPSGRPAPLGAADARRGLLVTVPVALLFLALLLFHGLDELDYGWLDVLIRHAGGLSKPDSRIVKVVIDEDTYKALGARMPFPSAWYARYFSMMDRLGARVQAADIYLYATPSEEDDVLLVETAARLGVILIARGKGSPPLMGRKGAEKLRLAGALVAFVKWFPRWFVIGEGGLNPLCVEIYGAARGSAVQLLPGDPPARERPWYLARGKSLAIGDRLVYLWGDRLLLSYERALPAGLFPSYRFEDVVSGRTPPGAFQDRLVLLTLHKKMSTDVHDTPLGLVEGPDLQCLGVRTLLDGRDFHRAASGIPAALLVIFALAGALVPAGTRPAALAAGAASLLCALLGASVLLYTRFNLFLPVAAASCSLGVSAMLLVLTRAGRLQQELDVSAAFVEEVNRSSLWGEGPEQWLGQILAISGRTCAADSGWLIVAEPDGALRLASSLGGDGAVSPEDLGGGISASVMASGAYRRIDDMHDAGPLSPFEARHRADSLIAFPLKGSRETLGVLALGKEFPGAFTPAHERQLATIAALAGALVENVRLSSRIHELFIDAISSLAKAVDARDPYTFGHSSRVAERSAAVARAMGRSEEEVKKLELAGILHDIGKIGIPEAVLRKPDKLTDEEFAVMRRHPDIAVSILAPLNEIYALLPVISGHHEKLDGTGYPKGLRADEIPPAAKILAVADIYDALTSERPYRKPSTPEQAIDIMRRHFRAHIDTAILDVLAAQVTAQEPEPSAAVAAPSPGAPSTAAAQEPAGGEN